MSKQTALEWLTNQFLEAAIDTITNENMYVKLPVKALKQAKQMEKEQIIDAYIDGSETSCGCYDYMENKNGEQYYNETYGGKP